MKSTVVDESLSSYKPMYCSREYQTSTRLNQQYEKSTLNKSCGCQKIDNVNGEIDSATINTFSTQGCVLVCFKTLNKSD